MPARFCDSSLLKYVDPVRVHDSGQTVREENADHVPMPADRAESLPDFLPGKRIQRDLASSNTRMTASALGETCSGSGGMLRMSPKIFSETSVSW